MTRLRPTDCPCALGARWERRRAQTLLQILCRIFLPGCARRTCSPLLAACRNAMPTRMPPPSGPPAPSRSLSAVTKTHASPRSASQSTLAAPSSYAPLSAAAPLPKHAQRSMPETPPPEGQAARHAAPPRGHTPLSVDFVSILALWSLECCMSDNRRAAWAAPAPPRARVLPRAPPSSDILKEIDDEGNGVLELDEVHAAAGAHCRSAALNSAGDAT